MLFVALVPLIVLVMYLLWRRAGRGRLRACRWRMNRAAPGEGVLFTCMECGAEARQPDERPPRTCFRTPR